MKTYINNNQKRRGVSIARDYETRKNQKHSSTQNPINIILQNKANQGVPPIQFVTLADLSSFTCRFQYREYEGLNALIVAIVKKVRQPYASDYGVTLIEKVLEKANDSALVLPESLSIEETINTPNPYREAIVQFYDDAVSETDGKTGTQLGEKADFVSYR